MAHITFAVGPGVTIPQESDADLAEFIVEARHRYALGEAMTFRFQVAGDEGVTQFCFPASTPFAATFDGQPPADLEDRVEEVLAGSGS